MPPTPGKLKAPIHVLLYDGTSPQDQVDGEALASFVRELVPMTAVTLREDFLGYWLRGGEEEPEKRKGEGEAVAEKLARIKVRRPDQQGPSGRPLKGEIDFERRFLAAGGTKPAGNLYDGYRLAAVYSELPTPEELSREHCHIALTNQLLGTWDRDDLRCHVRTSVYGFPSILSTTGLIQGPARPREFYLGRGLGTNQAALEEAFKGRFLGRGDPRLQEVIKGYLLQTLFYHVAGEPFCGDKECRLYNAHWQEEMIHAQTRPGADLCKLHRRQLAEWS